MNLSIRKFSMPKLTVFSKTTQAGVGLVIRPHQVELVSLQGQQIGSRVRVTVEGSGEDPMVQAIGRALAQADARTKQLAVSILSPEILTRSFTIPPIPKGEWEAAVQFEARKYIPFKMEQLTWDYHVIPASGPRRPSTSTAQTENLEVVFVGFPREAFGPLLRALSMAGLQPTVIEPLSLSLARLATTAAQPASEEFACLVDVQPQNAHLVIAKAGLPYMTRDIPLGSETGPSTGAAEPAPNPTAQRLLSELSVSMDFFTREHPSARISKVILFGEEDIVGPWQRMLAGQLRCPVELGTALVGAAVQTEVPLSFAAAVGLLQGGSSRRGASLDFLKRSVAAAASPADQSSPRQSPREMAQELVASLRRPQTIGIGLAAAGLSLVFCMLLGSQQVSKAEQDLRRLMSARPTMGMGLDGMTEKALKPIQDSAHKQLELLKQIVAQRRGAAEKLDALARSLPDGVWITSLTYEDRLDPAGKNQVRMDVNGACFLGGNGEEVGAIQAFETKVKKTPQLFNGFAVAQLAQINAQSDVQRQATYRTFQLSCRSERRM